MGHLGEGINSQSQTPVRTERRYARIQIDISVKVFAPGRPTSLGRGHDLGEGGLALYVPTELNIGDEVKLSFQLPYSRLQFGVAATVRNRQGFRYGMEFSALSAAESAEIERVTRVLEITTAK